MKPVLPLEAQHVITVLDECTRKIDMLSSVPYDLVHPECVSVELGNRAVESLREHLQLCEEYRSLQDGDAETQSIQQDARDSLRNFLRCIKPYKETESVKSALQEAGPGTKTDQKAMQELRARLQEFRDVVMERLMTSPKEEQDNKRYGQEVRERQQRNVESIHKLEQAVRAATEYRDNTIQKKDEEIQRMQSSLYQLEAELELFGPQEQKKAEQQHQSDLKNSDMKQLRLQEELNQLRARLDHLVIQCREKETALRKTNTKLEGEVHNWVEKYDAEMEDKEEKLENLTQSCEKQQAELRLLNEHVAVLDVEYSQIMEERQRERERREEEERELEMKTQAAVVIQAFWRRWRLHKAMKNKATKSTKSTKDKKGKKGKEKGKEKKKKGK